MENEPELKRGQTARESEAPELLEQRGALFASSPVVASASLVLPPVPCAGEEPSAFALRSARIGDWDFNLITGEARRSVLHDHCFGLFEPPLSWTMDDFLERTHPEDRERMRAEMEKATRQPGGFESQFRVIWPDGSSHWLWSRGWSHPDGRGGVDRLSGVTMEVTEARERDDQLARMASHDALTGLPNRALFRDRLEQAVRNARRREGRAGALYVDVDHFKGFNDTLGHAAGDELLRQIALRLESCKREEDTVSRFGGDEFAILCPDVVSKENVEALLKRVYAAMSRPMLIAGREVICSLSCGAALYPEDADGQEELLRRADAALYAAKRGGRARYEFYHSGLDKAASEEEGLRSDLQEAVERGEIYLEYQPVVEIDTGRAMTAEALARWRHPRLGLIAPERLIPLAERSGMMLALGEWTVRQALADWASWRHIGADALGVSVNVSSIQLRQEGFVERLTRALEQYASWRGCFQIELAESSLEIQSARDAARCLLDAGISVCVDDFGAGCSCLGRLAELPAQSFKLSPELTNPAALSTGSPAAVIVKGLASIVSELGAFCVVKHVESDSAKQALRLLGAQRAQGRHIAEPMRSENLLQWLIDRDRAQ